MKIKRSCVDFLFYSINDLKFLQFSKFSSYVKKWRKFKYYWKVVREKYLPVSVVRYKMEKKRFLTCNYKHEHLFLAATFMTASPSFFKALLIRFSLSIIDSITVISRGWITSNVTHNYNPSYEKYLTSYVKILRIKSDK